MEKKSLITRKCFENDIVLDKIIDAYPDALFVLNEKGQFIRANERFVRLLNTDVEKLNGQIWLHYVGEGLARAKATFQKVLEGEPSHFLGELLTTRQQALRVKMTFLPFTFKNGCQVAFTIVHDCSTETELRQRFQEREHLLHSLLHYNTNAIFVVDEKGLFTHVNSAAESITGYKKTELYNMHFFDLIHKGERRAILRKVWKALQGQGQTFEMMLNHHSVRETYLHVIFVPNMLDGVVKGVIGIAEDITEKKKMERRLAQLAEEDPLTGLPNRRYFMRELEQALKMAQKNAERVAVLFIDIDRFKVINDTLGHAFGDDAIVLLISRLGKLIAGKAKMARIGGDEFVVLLPHIRSSQEAIDFAEEIAKNIGEKFELNNYEFSLTASIGIALYPDSATDATTLIRCADAAMYRAKGQAIDKCQLYSADMKQSFNEWFKVESDLRRALERGEFELFYQPQYCLKTEELCGVEVLVRWYHPEDGLIPPTSFISIAEETGLIVPLGEWILREACQQMKAWIDNGLPEVPISINLSMRQFMYKNFVASIAEILEQSQLPPALLDLEITENITIDLHRSLSVIQQLKELGVRISLDDFGTGYSSLQYLAKFPIDELKIDQTFVRKISNNNGQAIVKMIINLAHLLKLKVVAEGVETKEQIEFLRKNGCDVGQGYFFHKPLTRMQYELIFSTEVK